MRAYGGLVVALDGPADGAEVANGSATQAMPARIEKGTPWHCVGPGAAPRSRQRRSGFRVSLGPRP